MESDGNFPDASQPQIADAMPKSPPTSPPTSPQTAALTTTVFRRGKLLITPAPGTELPPRCVKCNVEVNRKLRKKVLYWHHPALLLLILAGVLVYAIVALVVRKPLTVRYAMCKRHSNIRWRHILIVWLFVIGAGVFIWQGFETEEPMWFVVGVASFLVSMFYLVLFVPVFKPKRIESTFAEVSGCGRPFLDSLPEHPHSW